MKFFQKLTAVLLLAFWFTALLPVTVRAEADYTFYGDAGSTEYFVITSDETDVILEAYIESGSIPGMELNVASDVTLGLVGVPTADGEYHLSIYYSTRDHGDFLIQVTVYINPGSTASGTPTVTKNPTGENVVEGDSATFIARADNVKQYVWHIAIADASLTADELEDYVGEGLKVSGEDSDTLVLSNIPMTMDDAYIWCQFVGTEESVDSTAATLTVTAAKDAKPVITKNPTDETIEEGGRAVFIAKAKYTQSYLWYLVDRDGAAIAITDAVHAYPQLKVTGADTEKLVLENIPAELDGHGVYCSFTAGKVVTSETAYLHVTANPETQPTAEEATEPSAEATTEATEEPAETTEEPTKAPTEEPTEAPAETEPEKEEKKGGSNTLLIVCIICFAVVAVAGIAAYVILQLRDPLDY